MRLEELLRGIDHRFLAGEIKVNIEGIAYDSRQVKPGCLFVCISGFKSDGHLYIGEAINNGALAVVVGKRD